MTRPVEASESGPLPPPTLPVEQQPVENEDNSNQSDNEEQQQEQQAQPQKQLAPMEEQKSGLSSPPPPSSPSPSSPASPSPPTSPPQQIIVICPSCSSRPNSPGGHGQAQSHCLPPMPSSPHAHNHNPRAQPPSVHILDELLQGHLNEFQHQVQQHIQALFCGAQSMDSFLNWFAVGAEDGSDASSSSILSATPTALALRNTQQALRIFVHSTVMPNNANGNHPSSPQPSHLRSSFPSSTPAFPSSPGSFSSTCGSTSCRGWSGIVCSFVEFRTTQTRLHGHEASSLYSHARDIIFLTSLLDLASYAEKQGLDVASMPLPSKVADYLEQSALDFFIHPSESVVAAMKAKNSAWDKWINRMIKSPKKVAEAASKQAQELASPRALIMPASPTPKQGAGSSSAADASSSSSDPTAQMSSFDKQFYAMQAQLMDEVLLDRWSMWFGFLARRRTQSGEDQDQDDEEDTSSSRLPSSSTRMLPLLKLLLPHLLPLKEVRECLEAVEVGNVNQGLSLMVQAALKADQKAASASKWSLGSSSSLPKPTHTNLVLMRVMRALSCLPLSISSTVDLTYSYALLYTLLSLLRSPKLSGTGGSKGNNSVKRTICVVLHRVLYPVANQRNFASHEPGLHASTDQALPKMRVSGGVNYRSWFTLAASTYQTLSSWVLSTPNKLKSKNWSVAALALVDVLCLASPEFFLKEMSTLMERVLYTVYNCVQPSRGAEEEEGKGMEAYMRAAMRANLASTASSHPPRPDRLQPLHLPLYPINSNLHSIVLLSLSRFLSLYLRKVSVRPENICSNLERLAELFVHSNKEVEWARNGGWQIEQLLVDPTSGNKDQAAAIMPPTLPTSVPSSSPACLLAQVEFLDQVLLSEEASMSASLHPLDLTSGQPLLRGGGLNLMHSSSTQDSLLVLLLTMSQSDHNLLYEGVVARALRERSEALRAAGAGHKNKHGSKSFKRLTLVPTALTNGSGASVLVEQGEQDEVEQQPQPLTSGMLFVLQEVVLPLLIKQQRNWQKWHKQRSVLQLQSSTPSTPAVASPSPSSSPSRSPSRSPLHSPSSSLSLTQSSDLSLSLSSSLPHGLEDLVTKFGTVRRGVAVPVLVALRTVATLFGLRCTEEVAHDDDEEGEEGETREGDKEDKRSTPSATLEAAEGSDDLEQQSLHPVRSTLKDNVIDTSASSPVDSLPHLLNLLKSSFPLRGASSMLQAHPTLRGGFMEPFSFMMTSMLREAHAWVGGETLLVPSMEKKLAEMMGSTSTGASASQIAAAESAHIDALRRVHNSRALLLLCLDLMQVVWPAYTKNDDGAASDEDAGEKHSSSASTFGPHSLSYDLDAHSLLHLLLQWSMHQDARIRSVSSKLIQSNMSSPLIASKSVRGQRFQPFQAGSPGHQFTPLRKADILNGVGEFLRNVSAWWSFRAAGVTSSGEATSSSRESGDSNVEAEVGLATASMQHEEEMLISTASQSTVQAGLQQVLEENLQLLVQLVDTWTHQLRSSTLPSSMLLQEASDFQPLHLEATLVTWLASDQPAVRWHVLRALRALRELQQELDALRGGNKKAPTQQSKKLEEKDADVDADEKEEQKDEGKKDAPAPAAGHVPFITLLERCGCLARSTLDSSSGTTEEEMSGDNVLCNAHCAARVWNDQTSPTKIVQESETSNSDQPPLHLVAACKLEGESWSVYFAHLLRLLPSHNPSLAHLLFLCSSQRLHALESYLSLMSSVRLDRKKRNAWSISAALANRKKKEVAVEEFLSEQERAAWRNLLLLNALSFAAGPASTSSSPSGAQLYLSLRYLSLLSNPHPLVRRAVCLALGNMDLSLRCVAAPLLATLNGVMEQLRMAPGSGSGNGSGSGSSSTGSVLLPRFAPVSSTCLSLTPGQIPSHTPHVKLSSSQVDVLRIHLSMVIKLLVQQLQSTTIMVYPSAGQGGGVTQQAAQQSTLIRSFLLSFILSQYQLLKKGSSTNEFRWDFIELRANLARVVHKVVYATTEEAEKNEDEEEEDMEEGGEGEAQRAEGEMAEYDLDTPTSAAPSSSPILSSICTLACGTTKPLLSDSHRKMLFELFLSWCGHGPSSTLYVQKLKAHTQELLGKIASKSGQASTNTDAMRSLRLQVQASIDQLRLLSLQAMAALLRGKCFDAQLHAQLQSSVDGSRGKWGVGDQPWSIDGAAAAEPSSSKGSSSTTSTECGSKGFVFPWLNSLLLSPSPSERDVAYAALESFILHNEHLLPLFLTHCYVVQAGSSVISKRYFLVIGHVLWKQATAIRARQAAMASGRFQPLHGRAAPRMLKLPLSVLLHLLIFKLGDLSFSVRSMALRLIPIVEHFYGHAAVKSANLPSTTFPSEENKEKGGKDGASSSSASSSSTSASTSPPLQVVIGSHLPDTFHAMQLQISTHFATLFPGESYNVFNECGRRILYLHRLRMGGGGGSASGAARSGANSIHINTQIEENIRNMLGYLAPWMAYIQLKPSSLAGGPSSILQQQQASAMPASPFTSPNKKNGAGSASSPSAASGGASSTSPFTLRPRPGGAASMRTMRTYSVLSAPKGPREIMQQLLDFTFLFSSTSTTASSTSSASAGAPGVSAPSNGGSLSYSTPAPYSVPSALLQSLYTYLIRGPEAAGLNPAMGRASGHFAGAPSSSSSSSTPPPNLEILINYLFDSLQSHQRLNKLTSDWLVCFQRIALYLSRIEPDHTLKLLIGHILHSATNSLGTTNPVVVAPTTAASASGASSSSSSPSPTAATPRPLLSKSNFALMLLVEVAYELDLSGDESVHARTAGHAGMDYKTPHHSPHASFDGSLPMSTMPASPHHSRRKSAGIRVKQPLETVALLLHIGLLGLHYPSTLSPASHSSSPLSEDASSRAARQDSLHYMSSFIRRHATSLLINLVQATVFQTTQSIGLEGPFLASSQGDNFEDDEDDEEEGEEEEEGQVEGAGSGDFGSPGHFSQSNSRHTLNLALAPLQLASTSSTSSTPPLYSRTHPWKVRLSPRYRKALRLINSLNQHLGWILCQGGRGGLDVEINASFLSGKKLHPAHSAEHGVDEEQSRAAAEGKLALRSLLATLCRIIPSPLNYHAFVSGWWRLSVEWSCTCSNDAHFQQTSLQLVQIMSEASMMDPVAEMSISRRGSVMPAKPRVQRADLLALLDRLEKDLTPWLGEEEEQEEEEVQQQHHHQHGHAHCHSHSHSHSHSHPHPHQAPRRRRVLPLGEPIPPSTLAQSLRTIQSVLLALVHLDRRRGLVGGAAGGGAWSEEELHLYRFSIPRLFWIGVHVLTCFVQSQTAAAAARVSSILHLRLDPLVVMQSLEFLTSLLGLITGLGETPSSYTEQQADEYPSARNVVCWVWEYTAPSAAQRQRQRGGAGAAAGHHRRSSSFSSLPTLQATFPGLLVLAHQLLRTNVPQSVARSVPVAENKEEKKVAPAASPSSPAPKSATSPSAAQHNLLTPRSPLMSSSAPSPLSLVKDLSPLSLLLNTRWLHRLFTVVAELAPYTLVNDEEHNVVASLVDSGFLIRAQAKIMAQRKKEREQEEKKEEAVEAEMTASASHLQAHLHPFLLNLLLQLPAWCLSLHTAPVVTASWSSVVTFDAHPETRQPLWPQELQEVVRESAARMARVAATFQLHSLSELLERFGSGSFHSLSSLPLGKKSTLLAPYQLFLSELLPRMVEVVDQDVAPLLVHTCLDLLNTAGTWLAPSATEGPQNKPPSPKRLSPQGKNKKQKKGSKKSKKRSLSPRPAASTFIQARSGVVSGPIAPAAVASSSPFHTRLHSLWFELACGFLVRLNWSRVESHLLSQSARIGGASLGVAGPHQVRRVFQRFNHLLQVPLFKVRVQRALRACVQGWHGTRGSGDADINLARNRAHSLASLLNVLPEWVEEEQMQQQQEVEAQEEEEGSSGDSSVSRRSSSKRTSLRPSFPPLPNSDQVVVEEEEDESVYAPVAPRKSVDFIVPSDPSSAFVQHYLNEQGQEEQEEEEEEEEEDGEEESSTASEEEEEASSQEHSSGMTHRVASSLPAELMSASSLAELQSLSLQPMHSSSKSLESLPIDSSSSIHLKQLTSTPPGRGLPVGFELPDPVTTELALLSSKFSRLSHGGGLTYALQEVGAEEVEEEEQEEEEEQQQQQHEEVSDNEQDRYDMQQEEQPPQSSASEEEEQEEEEVAEADYSRDITVLDQPASPQQAQQPQEQQQAELAEPDSDGTLLFGMRRLQLEEQYQQMLLEEQQFKQQQIIKKQQLQQQAEADREYEEAERAYQQQLAAQQAAQQQRSPSPSSPAPGKQLSKKHFLSTLSSIYQGNGTATSSSPPVAASSSPLSAGSSAGLSRSSSGRFRPAPVLADVTGPVLTLDSGAYYSPSNAAVVAQGKMPASPAMRLELPAAASPSTAPSSRRTPSASVDAESLLSRLQQEQAARQQQLDAKQQQRQIMASKLGVGKTKTTVSKESKTAPAVSTPSRSPSASPVSSSKLKLSAAAKAKLALKSPSKATPTAAASTTTAGSSSSSRTQGATPRTLHYPPASSPRFK